MQRLPDEVLVQLGTVEVGGVYKVYVEFERTTEDLPPGTFRLCGVSPEPGGGQTHRAETDTVDREIAPDIERTGPGGGVAVMMGHG